MRIVLAVNGSRGDAQPAVALATELHTRGHDVTLAAPPDLVEFGRGAGIATEPYGGQTRELLDSDLVRSDLKSRNPLRRLRAISEISVRGGREMQQQLLDLTERADAVVATSAGQERAHNVAQVRAIPHIPLHYCPIRPNRSTSLLAQFGIDSPGALNLWSWRLVEHTLWFATRRAENTLRADIGLPPARTAYASQIETTGVPEIQAYDPVLFDGLAAEWNRRRPLVGFFDLAPRQRAGVGDTGLDDDLRGWLDAGDPPVYVGFGSMMPRDPDRLATAFREAAAQHRVRLLVSGGWSGFMSSADVTATDDIRVVGHIDHRSILPLCRAAVHHGGAGSLAAGLRAGLPTLVTWFGADQPIWGRAITTSGLGATLPVARVTTENLLAAFGTLLSPEVAERAADVARSMIDPTEAVTAAADIVTHVVTGSRK